VHFEKEEKEKKNNKSIDKHCITLITHTTMILPGRSLITRSIIRNVQAPLQTQPCGVDLTLKRVLKWTSPGVIDLDNKLRQTASTEELTFPRSASPALDLVQGSYLVEFNETVSVPLDSMGQIFVRSSLFRSGVLIHAGVMDSGYEGAVGALLQVVNPAGLRVYPAARLAQLVFHLMSEEVEGYNGTYQGTTSMG
jgi:dUTP pyrophosphatase